VGDEKFDSEKSLSLSAVQFTENPNYHHSVIEADGKKVGYYVYNFFTSGTDSNPDTYDAEMETIFTGFKTEGITDFVLDLRFNSGGSEKAAANLASLIGKDIDDTKVFAKRAYNLTVEKEILNDPDLGEDFLITKFSNEAGNIGSLLSGGRIYILTSSRTASASELVINALRPFMDVFLIGEVTYGKNVGSISIYEENDPLNKWGLQPIVVRVSNSLGQSDYGNGFTPNVLHEDNGLYIYPLGDSREALLAEALGQITGTSTSGRITSPKEVKELIGHSLDQKRRGFSLVIDQKQLTLDKRGN
jgi:C-terminal processing protease CtpA/Prc